MTTKPTHTPTPWNTAGFEIWAGSKRITMGQGSFDEKDRSVRRANVRFIIRAVNSHDAMVEALESALTEIDKLPGRDGLGLKLASALKLAKGE